MLSRALSSLALFVAALSAVWPAVEASSVLPDHVRRQLPAEPSNVTTIYSPGGVQIRYKMPGKEGVCETTEGVNSYSGYIDLDANHHLFFWFFESRKDPANDPVSLWLNGGPGSDSLIGLFQELGPCNISANLKSHVNPYAFNEVSNMLFLSQPVGVGFSYETEEPGTINNITGDYEPPSVNGIDGRYPVINATEITTSEMAAMACWHFLQGFYANLPKLDSKVKSKTFNLFTESYGGHWGPAFFHYFYSQNELISNGTIEGVELHMNSLGIINGIIDERIQAPYYPEFAVNNTYGIKSVNDTVYNYMKFAYYMPNGCRDQIDLCRSTPEKSVSDYAICAEAENMCRDNVEGPYYAFSGRGVYDIRHPYIDPTPPVNFINYLNQPSIQEALGVAINYTQDSNDEIYFAFQQTGDFVYQSLLEDLEAILDSGVRVSLIYGDADYICNWFGGQAISMQLNYTHSAQFRKAGYTPMLADGKQWGETKEYGNFSFTRVYESGHEVPYYQPQAALALFNRTITGMDIATGEKKITADLGTSGSKTATHTESFVALPTSTGS